MSIVWNFYLPWSNQLITIFSGKNILEVSLKIKTSGTIPENTKGGFPNLVCLKSMLILGKNFLISGLNCRLLIVWQFNFCPAALIIPDFSWAIKWEQCTNGAFVSPTSFYLIKSAYTVEKLCLKWGPSPLKDTLNSLATFLPNMWPKSLLRYARPHFPFVKWISFFCVPRDTLNPIEVSMWLCLSWRSVFKVF